MKLKLVVIGDTTDERFNALRQLAEEIGPTQTFPVRDDNQGHVNNMKLLNGQAREVKTRSRKVVSGTSTVDTLIKFIANRSNSKVTRKELEMEFIRVGYSKNSVGSALSICRAAGWVHIEGNVVVGRVLPNQAEVQSAIKEYYQKH